LIRIVDKTFFHQLSALEEENRFLHTKASRNNELASQLAASEEQVKQLREHKAYLQKELETARRELKRFRKELDGLSGQMNDMAEDMLESRSKVMIYAKKLGKYLNDVHYYGWRINGVLQCVNIFCVSLMLLS
jgi:chromosome segregation ATPase